MLVTVHGKAARQVPVLRAWERWVADAAASTPPDDFLWAPRTGRVHANTLWDFTASCNGQSPTASRLRATWLLTHVRAGTPMKELFRAGASSYSITCTTTCNTSKKLRIKISVAYCG